MGTVVYELRWPCAVLEYSSGADMFSSVCVSSSQNRTACSGESLGVARLMVLGSCVLVSYL